MTNKISKIISTEARVSKAGKPYTISTVEVDSEQEAEMFGIGTVGQEGTLEFDETYKKWTFKPEAKVGGGYGGGVKKFEADPKKMEQDKQLAIATNLSIQRQVAAKGAIELIVAGVRQYEDLQVTFDDIMSLIGK